MSAEMRDRHCSALAPHREAGKLDPADITIRRMERFFGTAGRPEYGICAHFEQIGDQLWQADEIARELADRVPGGYRAVIERFKFSVKAGKFGPPVSKGRFAVPEALSYDQQRRAETTCNLIDLDSAVIRPPAGGQYALRPSILVAEELAPYMRARQSVWAHWIAAQRWPAILPSSRRAPAARKPRPAQEAVTTAMYEYVNKLPAGKVLKFARSEGMGDSARGRA
jgi:hypothetical protein